MQCPIDPHEQTALLDELVSGGIATLVARRIVQTKGEPLKVAADTQHHMAVLERFDQVVRCGDPAELDELCTPDMVNHALAASRPAGLDGTREFLLEWRRDPRRSQWIRGNVYRDEQIIAERDLVAQFAVLEAVWPGGTFRVVSTSSGPCTTDAAFLYRFVDGRIAERWAVRDDLGMMRQLGAIR